MTRTGGEAARAFVESPRMDEAVETLVDAPLARPQAIGLCFTGSSYVLGPDGDLALKARLETRAGGVPVALTCLSAVAALRAFAARRVALIHPPWFAEDMDRRGVEDFKQQGFEVVYHARAPLRGDRGNVQPGALYEWARANVPREAEAVFMGGNGMRTIGAIQALEEALGRPVITSNQVTFWAALRLRRSRHLSPATANSSRSNCRLREETTWLSTPRRSSAARPLPRAAQRCMKCLRHDRAG